MDGAIGRVGEGAQVPPPRRDRRTREENEHKPFNVEMEAEDGDDEVVLSPAPRRSGARPVAPPQEDEAGYRLDVKA